MDNGGPSIQVGQPAQDALGREHDVELPIEHVREVVDVGADEPRIQPQLVVQRPGEIDRGVGEVDTCSGCATFLISPAWSGGPSMRSRRRDTVILHTKGLLPQTAVDVLQSTC